MRTLRNKALTLFIFLSPLAFGQLDTFQDIDVLGTATFNGPVNVNTGVVSRFLGPTSLGSMDQGKFENMRHYPNVASLGGVGQTGMVSITSPIPNDLDYVSKIRVTISKNGQTISPKKSTDAIFSLIRYERDYLNSSETELE